MTTVGAISTRPKSPTRAEAISKALVNQPCYSKEVLIGDWIDKRFESEADPPQYYPPQEKLDYEKLKPESRQPDFRINKLISIKGNMPAIITHDSHDGCPNYTSTNELVYSHLPKPLCGPIYRYYKRCKHQWYPQPDLLECFGNLTEWGLRRSKEYEWQCTDVSDYQSSLYEDTYIPPRPHQYLPRNERKARNSSFTKSFRFKMTKPIPSRTKR